MIVSRGILALLISIVMINGCLFTAQYFLEPQEDEDEEDVTLPQPPIDEQRIVDCDFLKREEFLVGDPSFEELPLTPTKVPKEIPLDPKATGPFLYVQLDSGLFNQHQSIWPTFILAKELNVTILFGPGLSRNTFKEFRPSYHPVHQSVLWDVGYMQQYWKKRGVEVYFSNFEPLIRKLMFSTNGEDGGEGVFAPRPLTGIRHFGTTHPFNFVSLNDQQEEVWDRTPAAHITPFIDVFVKLEEHPNSRVITRTNIKHIVENETRVALKPNMLLWAPSSMTFGSFATHHLNEETRKMAQEAYLSIHIAPRLLEMGCDVWETVREQAGDKTVVGVHLRIETDALVWWTSHPNPTAEQLAQYGQQIFTAIPEPRPPLFGYLAYGDVPPELEAQVVEWANSIFAGWTTKNKTLEQVKKRKEIQRQEEEQRRSIEEAKNHNATTTSITATTSATPIITIEELKERRDRRKARIHKRYLGIRQQFLKDVVNTDSVRADEVDIEREQEVMALVDAYVLTRCNVFVGYASSSFSFVVEQWRTHLGLPSSYLRNYWGETPLPPLYRAW